MAASSEGWKYYSFDYQGGWISPSGRPSTSGGCGMWLVHSGVELFSLSQWQHWRLETSYGQREDSRKRNNFVSKYSSPMSSVGSNNGIREFHCSYPYRNSGCFGNSGSRRLPEKDYHPHSEVDGEMVAWIPNIRSSWSRETIDLYRHMKALLSRALTEKQVVHNGFSMQLKCIQLQIKVLHKKVSLLV
jgi:hypothetical protein